MKHETPDQFNLGAPSLKALAHVLRNPDLWKSIPGMRDYEWGWSCNKCAMNAAHRMWADMIPHGSDQNGYKDGMMKMFGISDVDARSLFFGGYGHGVPHSAERMADLIDEYIKKGVPSHIQNIVESADFPGLLELI